MSVQVGKLIEEGEPQKDAIHVAVAPVEAAEDLQPGQHIGFVANSRVLVGRVNELIGVVDPYLIWPVPKGAKFYMFVYPNTVTGMRHEWEHPAFMGNRTESERWLREFISKADCPDYDTVVAAATGRPVPAVDDAYYPEAYRLVDYGDGLRLYFGGRDAHSDIPPEFWDHVEVVTGKAIPQSKRAVGFSCSC
jgi:hypothetical protein